MTQYRELSEAQQAALALVFIWHSRLPVRSPASDEAGLVADKYGIATGAIFEALPQLENTFLVRREENWDNAWSFIHPTFVDAITSILSDRPDLVDLYLRGTKFETLLNEALCDGAGSITDAIIIPPQANDRLIERLSFLERAFQIVGGEAPKLVNVERQTLRQGPPVRKLRLRGSWRRTWERNS